MSGCRAWPVLLARAVQTPEQFSCSVVASFERLYKDSQRESEADVSERPRQSYATGSCEGAKRAR